MTEQNNINPIMSYNNGHNKELVDKIHIIGNDPQKIDRLYNILTFLANDYKDEVIEYVLDDEWGEYYKENPLTYSEVSNHSYEILTNVCDDNDLETIISYCRLV